MDGPLPIVVGYEWRERVQIEAGSVPLEIFPAGSTLSIAIKTNLADAVPLATLTTELGHIERVDDATIDIIIPTTITSALKKGHVYLDVVRTDTMPPEYQYLQMRLLVI